MPVERFSIDVSLIVKLSDLGAISPTLNELEISLTTKFASPSPRLIFHSPFYSKSIISVYTPLLRPTS